MNGDWRACAACGPETAELFDPPGPADRRNRGADRFARAAAICAGCPVAAECLAEGTATKASGIRAGKLLEFGDAAALPLTAPDIQAARPVARPLKPCGTHAAFVRHKAHGEHPCARCETAEKAYQATCRPRRPRPPLKPCGTHAAFVRHKAHGEDPCARCEAAEKAYQAAHPRDRQRVAA